MTHQVELQNQMGHGLSLAAKEKAKQSQRMTYQLYTKLRLTEKLRLLAKTKLKAD